jgi:antitoxin MazE
MYILEARMKTRVQRWGNSLAVRIPKLLADEIAFSENTDVDLVLRHGELVVSLAKRKRYVLEDLLVGMTPDNRHGEIGWGAPAGNEIIP